MLLSARRVLNRIFTNRIKRPLEQDEILANDQLIKLISKLVLSNLILCLFVIFVLDFDFGKSSQQKGDCS